MNRCGPHALGNVVFPARRTEVAVVNVDNAASSFHQYVLQFDVAVKNSRLLDLLEPHQKLVRNHPGRFLVYTRAARLVPSGVVAQVLVSEVLQFQNGYSIINVLKVSAAYNVCDNAVFSLAFLQEAILAFKLLSISGVLDYVHNAVLLH